MPQDVVLDAFEEEKPVKRGPGRPKKEAVPTEKAESKERTVRLIIHTTSDGSDDRMANIIDPRASFDSGKKLKLPRNEIIEVDYRVPDLLAGPHRIKIIEEEVMVDGKLTRKRREVHIPRFPFTLVD